MNSEWNPVGEKWEVSGTQWPGEDVESECNDVSVESGWKSMGEVWERSEGCGK